MREENVDDTRVAWPIIDYLGSFLLFDELRPDAIPSLGLNYILARSVIVLEHTRHLRSLCGSLIIVPQLVCRDDADGNTPAAHIIDAVGIVGWADNLVFVDIIFHREFLTREREACEQVVPVLRRRKLVGKNISHEAALHPVVNEPTVPMDLVHYPEVTPGVEVLHRWLAGEEVVAHLVGFSPRLCKVKVPEYVMVLDHAPSNVGDHEDHLVADASPSPYPLMMRVVGLDEGVVRCTLEGEVPLILGGNSRQSFHLNIHHSLIATGIANDDSLLVVHVGGHVGVRRHPFTVPVA
mmetsp:Transcript_11484/g.26241  ORF Transcript_11484/g.26241 Transcript_11484/m.26241 type:complete len:294 (-) Transcript_11484:315-1196(-)